MLQTKMHFLKILFLPKCGKLKKRVLQGFTVSPWGVYTTNTSLED